MRDFETHFPLILDGVKLHCRSLNPNNSSVVMRLELLNADGEIRQSTEQEFQLWQKDLKKPGPLLKRVKESVARLDLDALDEVRDLFLVYPKFKPLKRDLTLEKLKESIRKAPENGIRGIAGPPRVTSFWPEAAQTVLSLARLYEHLEYSSLKSFVDDSAADEVQAQRTALDKAGCTQMLAAVDSVVAGGQPSSEFNELAALEDEVTPALERYIDANADVLFG